MIVAIASFSKCVRFIMFSKRKAGVFKFLRFEECLVMVGLTEVKLIFQIPRT